MTCEVKHIFSYAHRFFTLSFLNCLIMYIASSLVHSVFPNVINNNINDKKIILPLEDITISP